MSRPHVLLILILALTMAIVGVAEALHRMVPRDVSGGWLPDEFHDRLAQVDPRRDIVFVGDSRIGYGIADRIVTRNLRSSGYNLEAYNLGNPGGGSRQLKGLAQTLIGKHPEAGTLVIGISPAFLYSFENNPLSARSRTFNPLERKIDAFFNRALTARVAQIPNDLKYFVEGRPPRVIWAERRVYEDGFVNATLARSDGAPVDIVEHQLQYYRVMLRGILDDQAAVIERRKEFVDFAARFRDAGWRVVLVRLPIGPDLLALEDSLPAEMKMPSLQAMLGVPAIDYTQDPRSRDLPTLDQSHLSPDGARLFADILAADLKNLLAHPNRMK